MRDGDTGSHSIDGFSPPETVGTRPDPLILAQLPVFEGIEGDLARKLICSCSGRQYRAGTFIVRAGEPLEGLHIVLRGIVDLTHVDGEDECGVLLLSARDLLLPATTLFREPALVSARALTTTKVMVIDGAVTQEALSRSTVFAVNLMKAVSGQWRMAVRNILDLNCRSAAQRLGAFLLRIADLQHGAGGAVLPIPKRHLAIRLGMTAETLSRMLQVVANHGLYLRGRTIIVRDRPAIEEFCGPDPYPEKDERMLDVFAL
jgi:CRP/FNR family transcriptional activator FtrB